MIKPLFCAAAFGGMNVPLSQSFPSLVLLDRDGVINEDVGAPGVICPSQLRLTTNAALAIGSLRRRGANVALITNQSCVGKGLLTPKGLEDIHGLLQQLLLQDDKDAYLDKIYVCTSTKDDNDPRMKPHPGMILEAMDDFSVAPEDCIFVGDTVTDMQAAHAAGIERRMLVETGYGLGLMNSVSAATPTPQWVHTVEHNDDLNSVTPFVYTKNLYEAVSWLCDGGNIPC